MSPPHHHPKDVSVGVFLNAGHQGALCLPPLLCQGLSRANGQVKLTPSLNGQVKCLRADAMGNGEEKHAGILVHQHYWVGVGGGGGGGEEAG
ncbi:hypothetical protein JZ751_004455 [Albula glossodonta]|uniref:Uncharacterized protein n=1 Tax=Albula glossodonta TaxID=121402 RepID=A0A8T2NCV4_9TELE|nr:hypothetical protein JZ751_004455 [Albula glossodonta]